MNFSSNQLAKNHKKIYLYTDTLGKEILIDKLHLPYTQVNVVLDELKDYNKNLWAIGKIKTYQLQDEPFIHVDGDVFVWEKIDLTFKNSALISQNLEKTTHYYRSMWNQIAPNLNFIPSQIQRFNNNENNYASNMGIVGGTDLEFFKKYTECSLNFVNQNKEVWELINASNFNIFFEQVLFYEMASDQNIKIDLLIDEIIEDDKYVGFGDFDRVPEKIIYTFLVQSTKKVQGFVK